MTLRAEQLDSRTREAWDAFVEQQPAATPFQLAGWLAVLREAFRVEPIYRVLIDAGDRIDGVAPMYYSSSLIAGKHIATLDGGILARTPEAGQILLHDATEQARQRGARYLLMRGGVAPTNDVVTTTRVYPCLPLTAGIDAIRGSLGKKMRNQIRRVEKLALTVAHQRSIPHEFYHVFARTQKSLGTPVPPRQLFTALNINLSERVHFFGLADREKLVAGMVCLTFNDQLHSMYAATEHSYQREYANYLLYLRVIEWALDEHIALFNMGRSKPGTGPHAFKLKWRSVDRAVDYCHVPLVKQDSVKGIFGTSHERSALATHWRRLPSWAANWLGPILRRRLPFG